MAGPLGPLAFLGAAGGGGLSSTGGTLLGVGSALSGGGSLFGSILGGGQAE